MRITFSPSIHTYLFIIGYIMWKYRLANNNILIDVVMYYHKHLLANAGFIFTIYVDVSVNLYERNWSYRKIKLQTKKIWYFIEDILSAFNFLFEESIDSFCSIILIYINTKLKENVNIEHLTTNKPFVHHVRHLYGNHVVYIYV